MFSAIEAGLTVLALVLAFTVPNLGARWCEAVERSFSKLAQRRSLSVLVVGLTALVLRAALLPILPFPTPIRFDEFAYLLLSDTFAHGRLTNPTSPMWMHFEAFHVIWQPTYTAKYYPAQGLIMAFGQAVMGHPFWGVWLSVGLMCAAITWMLQGWLTPGWALLGGFLTVIPMGTFSYWANSYWGGAVTAIGGALVLGALPRLKQRQRMCDALLMGLGFAILGNSRPYEGLFFGIPVAASLVVWLWRKKQPELGQALKRVMVPLLAVLAVTLVAMGYYFWRTTGSPFSTPYLIYERTYNPIPYFPWQSLKPFPAYHHHIQFRRYYLSTNLDAYKASRTAAGLAVRTVARLVLLGSFFLGPVLVLPVLLLPMVLPRGFKWRDISSEVRFLLVVCGVVIAANMPPLAYLPHYSAPITAAIFALLLVAMQNLSAWQWHGKAAGLFIVRAVPSICVLALVFRAAVAPLGLPVNASQQSASAPDWCWRSASNGTSAPVSAKLRKAPGEQLVIVHYSADHDPLDEWVYNRADLNSAKIIWARDMGPAKNEELINYFRNRCAWLVYADDHPPRLVPYSEFAGRGIQVAGEKGSPISIEGDD